MEGIGTADAILSQVYPQSDFAEKDRLKQERVYIAIRQFKMDRLEKLHLPLSPVSLMIDHTKLA